MIGLSVGQKKRSNCAGLMNGTHPRCIQIATGNCPEGSAEAFATASMCGIMASAAAITSSGRSCMSMVRPIYPRNLSARMSNGLLRIPQIDDGIEHSVRNRSTAPPNAEKY